MSNRAESFHRSTLYTRNDGTAQSAERTTERKSVKAAASAVLQRNATRNDRGTAADEMAASFHGGVPFHRSIPLQWNGGTVEVWGAYTPYCCPVAPAVITELRQLIGEYAAAFRLSESETARIIAAAKRQPAASVPAAADWFRNQLSKEKS